MIPWALNRVTLTEHCGMFSRFKSVFSQAILYSGLKNFYKISIIKINVFVIVKPSLLSRSSLISNLRILYFANNVSKSMFELDISLVECSVTKITHKLIYKQQSSEWHILRLFLSYNQKHAVCSYAFIHRQEVDKSSAYKQHIRSLIRIKFKVLFKKIW